MGNYMFSGIAMEYFCIRCYGLRRMDIMNYYELLMDKINKLSPSPRCKDCEGLGCILEEKCNTGGVDTQYIDCKECNGHGFTIM